jgi:hypothetical protein
MCFIIAEITTAHFRTKDSNFFYSPYNHYHSQLIEDIQLIFKSYQKINFRY